MATTYTTGDRQSVASYSNYGQSAIAFGAPGGFPVDGAEIVGSDLRTVEHVTGRMTKGRATLYGAGGGALWGLFFGLLVGVFTTGAEWAGLVAGGVVLGAMFGATFGFFAQL